MTVKEKTCTQCNETKPIKQFKRRLTIAQSRSMLRNPKISTPYITTSKLCKACQPKRHTPLSTKEIRSKITTGDIHRTIGEAMLKEMKEAIPKTRARIMKEYWREKKTGWEKPFKAKIQRQVAKYLNRYQSYKSILTKGINANPPKMPTPTQHAKLAQHSWNYKEAKRVRDEVFAKIDEGVRYDSLFHIQTLIKPMKYNQGEQA